MKSPFLIIALLMPALASCESKPNARSMSTTINTPAPCGAETITLGAGCYWCIEAVFRQIDGVHSVTSGFMGGHDDNPSYDDVCEGITGHAEVVQVVFDPQRITLQRLLDWFWELHDPTTLNRQGNDVGTQYRSAIFYHTDEQERIATASRAAAAADFPKPIVTEITKASKFHPASTYHQDYYFRNKAKNPYCRFVIEPKLRKLKLNH